MPGKHRSGLLAELINHHQEFSLWRRNPPIESVRNREGDAEPCLAVRGHMLKMGLGAACAVAVPSLAFAAGQSALVTKEPAVVPPAAFTWTGAYVGLNAGFTWGNNSADFTFFPFVAGLGGPTAGLPATTSLRSSGFIGGAQLGYNYQMGSVVFGPEADFAWTGRSVDVTASGTGTNGVPLTMTVGQSLDWLGTTRFRLGFTPINRLLVYGTGGIAYARVSPSTRVVFPAVSYFGNNSGVRVGWAAGLGAEYAIKPALSAKLEYLYYDLGDTTVTGFRPPISPFRSNTVFNLNGQLVRVGLNYKYDSLQPRAPTSSQAPGDKNFQLEFGTRYRFSSGKTVGNLFNTTGSLQVSRLTYSGLTAHAAEMFARIDHVSGLFLKGYGGLGPVTGGNLKDEDLPPAIVPYSATSSNQKDGTLTYATIDAGYDFLRTPSYRLGPLVGYNYYREKLTADGCTQMATNHAICVPAIPDSIQVIRNDAQWNSVRLGLNGQGSMIDRLTLSADAAWLPHTRLSNQDTHLLRINTQGGFTGPTLRDGTGHDGYQVEAILSYRLTPVFSIGGGGRYRHTKTTGTAHFVGVVIGGPGQPEVVKSSTDRYGGFIQGSLQF